MSKIFLSYRREDSAGFAERIYDSLRVHFRLDTVFFDIDAVPPGVDFQEHIESVLSQCDVFLAVIGPHWAGESDTGRRIDNPKDWVRIEIEAALKQGLPVIPVLINHTRMPSEADLPPSLVRLARHHAVRVDQGLDFHHHVSRLIKGIEFHLEEPQPLPPRLGEQQTNSLGMTLVRIEPGSFLMGSTKDQIDQLMRLFPNSKREWFDDEQPQHPVKITRSFFLGIHQVTVGQFRRFVEGSGHRTEAEKDGKGSYVWKETKKTWELDPGKNWRNPGFSQTDDHPVVCVSYNDATAFCQWLSQTEGLVYRLPTEAEWEFACRAGTTTLYPNGDDPEGLVIIADVADATLKSKFPDFTCIEGDDRFLCTAPVGSFAPNSWGLYDMIGNVWEWCADWYDGRYYSSSPPADPPGPAGATYRVIRGGGWGSGPRYARSANRNRFVPEDRVNALGFRLARVQSGR